MFVHFCYLLLLSFHFHDAVVQLFFLPQCTKSRSKRTAEGSEGPSVVLLPVQEEHKRTISMLYYAVLIGCKKLSVLSRAALFPHADPNANIRRWSRRWTAATSTSDAPLNPGRCPSPAHGSQSFQARHVSSNATQAQVLHGPHHVLPQKAAGMAKVDSMQKHLRFKWVFPCFSRFRMQLSQVSACEDHDRGPSLRHLRQTRHIGFAISTTL